MPTTLDDLLLARATDMAVHDGDVLSTVYIVAATNNLQVELFAARERILAAPPVAMIVAGAAHEANEPVAITEPEPATETVVASKVKP